MPSLAYWKIRGLAQPMRLLLNYVGEKFEDVQYEMGEGPDFSRDTWLKVKPTLGLDFPNLPYYIDGDIKITQSNAILRHIARKHDLLGKTEKERVNVDMMLDNAMDLRNGVVGMAYNPNYEKMIKEYEYKDILAGYEKWLSNKTWFGGENVTVVDFPMYELLDQHRLMIPGCLDKYPKLTDFMKRFEALPKIKEYMASDKFMKRPINNKCAKFK
ncbi:glutathione S-transferase Mu 2-like [Littorina saxatilis]|uniref:glutathione transferase n=1 Tax=Littorina saxatilis TaxID=31220 RepID=A0AAN9BEE3_9CAEN